LKWFDGELQRGRDAADGRRFQMDAMVLDAADVLLRCRLQGGGGCLLQSLRSERSAKVLGVGLCAIRRLRMKGAVSQTKKQTQDALRVDQMVMSYQAYQEFNIGSAEK